MLTYLSHMTTLQTAVMLIVGFVAITQAYRGKWLFAVITITMWALGMWIGTSMHLMS